MQVLTQQNHYTDLFIRFLCYKKFPFERYYSYDVAEAYFSSCFSFLSLSYLK